MASEALGSLVLGTNENVERLLNDVGWTPVKPPAPGENPEGLPYATHVGTLSLPGLPPLRVHVLNTGQRIIDQDDLAAFFVEGVTQP